MAELQTNLGLRVLMHESHDPFPGIALLRVPQSRATIGDASLRGYTGHLSENESRAPECATAVVDEVPLSGQPVARHVLRHGRYDDAVRKLQPAPGQRQEHRRSRFDVRSALLCQPALVLRDKGRVTQL